MTTSDGRLGRWGCLAILGGIIAIDAIVVGLRDEPVLIASWWSSVGLLVVLLARSPVRRWPLLLVVAGCLSLAVHPAFGEDVRTGTVVAGSRLVQAVIAALLLTHGGRRGAVLDSPAALARLTGAGFLAGVVAAVVEAPALPGFGPAAAETTLQVGMQHALSVILFGALLLSPRREVRPRLAAVPLVPAAVWVQSATLVLALAVVFVPDTPLPITFLPLPVLVWGAILLDARYAAGQLLLLGAFATITTADEPGPFNPDTVNAYLVGPLTLGYVASAALVTLPLAIVVGQRRELLRRSAADEHLFRRTFSESPLGMLMMREEGASMHVVELNPAAERVLGVAAEDVVGHRLSDLVGAVDHRDDPFHTLLVQDADLWHGPASVLSRPGSRVDLAIAAISGSPGARVFSAQLLDQTREHDSRQRLEIAHQLTDTTLDTAACIILLLDDTGTIVRANAATQELTGYDDSELVGLPVWESPLAVLSRSETEAMFVWPNRSGYPMARERLSHRADGTPIRLVWNNNVVGDGSEGTSYAVLTGVDVTAERSTTGLMAHLLQASIATALIGIDVSGRITVLNAGAAHMLGCSEEELIGRPFVSVLDPTQLNARTGAAGAREAFLCLVGMIGYGDESETRDWTWRTRDGHELTVSMTLSVTDPDVTDRVGFLCVGRDVTEQREGQDTLVAALDKERTAVERLRALDRAKDEFVSTVSHELRTPVTSILGYTELLLEGEVVDPHPQQRGMLETIARNGHRLVAICNDLLLLSGFESREIIGTREVYDLRDALCVAEEYARVARGQRPLTLTFSAPERPVTVSGDRSQLDRVLVNLVSNALKFTDDGGSVTVELTLDGSHDEAAVVTVTDTGIGIDVDDQELVFQRFYRTEDAQAQAIPGTGLGLAIVAGIVDAHDGTVSLHSVPGTGTTVTVRLPAHAPVLSELPPG